MYVHMHKNLANYIYLKSRRYSHAELDLTRNNVGGNGDDLAPAGKGLMGPDHSYLHHLP